MNHADVTYGCGSSDHAELAAKSENRKRATIPKKKINTYVSKYMKYLLAAGLHISYHIHVSTSLKSRY